MSTDETVTKEGLPYAIVRGGDSGVVCGFAEHVEDRVVRVLDARQMYEWDSTFVLIDLATNGVRNAESCRFSVPNGAPTLVLDACAIIECTPKGAKSLIDITAEHHKS